MLPQSLFKMHVTSHGEVLQHLLNNLASSYGSYLKFGRPDEIHRTAQVIYGLDGVRTPNPDGVAPECSVENTPDDLTFVKDLSPVDLERYTASKFIQIYNSASRREKGFDLTLSDVKRLLKKRVCHYTGIPVGTSSDKEHPQQITFDRVDATLGYTKDNVVTCCHSANQFKNTIEHEFTGVLSRPDQLKMLTKMFS